MPLPSQRILAPATSALAPKPPIPSKTAVKRTKISRACSACQERRSKCSGGVPCTKCYESDTECLVDPGTDNRRRALLLQKINQLQCTITNIIETLRDEEKAEWLISVVRSDASVEQIQQVLARDISKDDNSSRASETPESTTLVEAQSARESGLRDIREVMAIEHLTRSC
ncbi:hypothetical protein BJX62DRAFT_186872 [Aspergillus germanicus]